MDARSPRYHNQPEIYEDEDSDDTCRTMSVEDEPIHSMPRRRARGPSRSACPNRNALMARENRERKKKYVEQIENNLEILQKHNQALQATVRKQGNENRKLRLELEHVRSVLSNDTAIVTLLRSINGGIRANAPGPLPRTASKRSRVSCSDEGFSSGSSPEYPHKRPRLPEDSPSHDHTYTWVKNDVSLLSLNAPFSNEEIVNNLDEQMLRDPIFSSPEGGTDLEEKFDVDALFPDCFKSMDNEFEEDLGFDLDTLPSVGVCIHVNHKGVSLEFCPECQTRNEIKTEEGIEGF